jgi:diaminohydroxyphosphoribosylaminopyrimidine deaminase / 5-amino-6-(5-phosphoribosylamino)uracil reductase
MPELFNKKWLQIAIHAAKLRLGKTYPNPAVGAVIVKDNLLLSKAATGFKGSPHAEVGAINKLSREQLLDATLYVTLEPCDHIGRNPSCCDLIIKSGIKRVVIGCIDINPIVRGRGVKKLNDNGVIVEILNDNNAKDLHKMFFHYISFKLPYLTCKMATSLDGKIALANKESKWITSELSRNYVHLLRSRHDAVLTGVGTIIQDNPTLNCRIKSYNKNSTIVILDRNLDIPLFSNILDHKIKRKTLIYTTSEDQAKMSKLINDQTEVIRLRNDEYNDSRVILQDLAKKGITSIFCEAGKLITKFVKTELINELVVFRTGKFFGGDSFDMCGDLDLKCIADAKSYRLVKVQNIQNRDVIEHYIKS